MTKYNVLITGGLGLIGTFLGKKFAAKKSVKNVICLDHFGKYINPQKKNLKDYRFLRSQLIGKKLIIERGEAKYYSVLSKIILKYKPKYIIHLAALPLAKLENLNSEEALEGSVVSTTSIIETINSVKNSTNYNFKRFVYASSSMVYGDFKKMKVTEDHPTNPKEIYGTAKLAGEILCKGLCKFYNIDYSIVRPSAVYGPTDMNNRVTQIFLDKALKGEKLKVEGKDEKLDFTYIKDIAEGFYLATTHSGGKNQIFNITYGKARKLLDYVKILKKNFKDLEYKIYPRDKFRPKRGTLNITKAKKLINYKPKYPIEKGVKEYLYFKKNMKVDLVIPFYNEEKNLEILIPELNKEIPSLKNDYRVIFVNDGSRDQSEKKIREKIENISFVILTNDRNLGQTSAFQKAFDNCLGDFIIRMDSDLQDNPKDLIKFDELLSPDIDIILGYRGKRKHNLFLRIATYVFDKIMIFMGYSKLLTSSGSFIAFNSVLLKGIRLKKNDHRYLPIIAQSLGAKNNKVINIDHRKRIYGKSNYNTLIKIFLGLIELINLIKRLKNGFYKKKTF